MQLARLVELYNECRFNPSYQYKDTPEDIFLKNAAISFNRIKDTQKDLVLTGWAKKLQKPKTELTEEDINGLLKFRYLSQTNLYFLCHLLESYNQTTINTHEDICNEFFVRKDPTFITFEDFANQYSDLKERLLLVPRGGFKSSIDMVDCIQWFICYPTITIGLLTGRLDLAEKFVGEIRKHMTYEIIPNSASKKPEFGVRQLMDRYTGEWSDAMIQVLFPEHCIVPGEGSQTEFQTPAASDQKEPTISSNSIRQGLSGAHYCVLKLDDVVTNENTKTRDRIKDVNKQISINKALKHPYGFFDVIGTWYDEFDYYGTILKKEEKYAKENGMEGSLHGSIDSGRFNSSIDFKTYVRACWWPKDSAKGKIEEELTKDDLVLWFPERLTYEFLKKEERADSDVDDEDGDTGHFAIKYLNNPRKISKIKFPRDLLVRRTLPYSQIPPQGIFVTTVDTAYSIKAWADYTVIITALIFGGRFYIVNMVRGRFNEDELPRVIANVGYRWKPRRIAIEDSIGVKWFKNELRREMDKLQISIPLEYITLGKGSKLRSKQIKAKPVLRLLGDERMYFSNSCEGLEEIYNELEKFTGTSDDKHDDVVSGLSLVVEAFGSYADMDSRVNSINNEYVSEQQSQTRHNIIYGIGKYAKYNASQGYTDDNPTTNFQVGQIVQNVQEPYYDPFSDLLG